jgi:DNA-binding response OmpR family regulator
MPNTRKILIVDDDPELRDALTEQLSLHEEFEAVAAENGSKGVPAAKAGQIDLVIMDVGLPDIHGREAVRILRRNGFKAPIIMLTGHDTDSDTCPSRESYPLVAMMQSGQDRCGDDVPCSLDGSS